MSRSNSEYNIDITYNSFSLDTYFELVIHAAGKAHQLTTTPEEADEFYKVNVHGTTNLLKALEKPYPPKLFVFISTVAVYGLNQGNLIKEDAPLLAKDPYGLSKIQGENLVQEWCKKHGVICTILRLPLIAGPNPPGNLGLMIKGIQKSYYFNNRLEVIQKKTGKKVTLPIHPLVKEIFTKYNYRLPKIPNNNEFNRLIKEVGALMPSMQVEFSKQITYERERIVITKPKFQWLQGHCPRRSLVTNEFLKGTDVPTIMSISGHKSYKNFLRYIKASGEEHAEKLEKIWQERYTGIS